MQYCFCILSSEIEDFYLRISIDGTATFDDFHQSIQCALNFDTSQLASFEIVDNNWRKLLDVIPIDTGHQLDGQYIMHKTSLNTLLHHRNVRLLYRFDLFNERALFIELIDITMEKNLEKPIVESLQGITPEQILTESFISGVWVDDESFDKKQKNAYGEVEDYSEIYGEMIDL